MTISLNGVVLRAEKSPFENLDLVPLTPDLSITPEMIELVQSCVPSGPSR